MRNSNRLTIAAAIGVVFPLGQPVCADEFVDTTQSLTQTTTNEVPAAPANQVLIERPAVIQSAPLAPPVTSGRVVTTEQQTTRLAPSDSQLLLQTIDNRHIQLRRQLMDAQSAGTLPVVQALEFQRELDRIDAEIATLKAMPQPGISRIVGAGGQLDALVVRMKPVITTLSYAPIIEGSHFTIVDGRIVQLDEPAVRRVMLESKIIDEQNLGKITYDQANILRAALDRVGDAEDTYRMKGSLTDAEARQIYDAMDRVAVQLDRFERIR